MESSKVQARSLQKEIEQRVFAKHSHHEEITRWHVDDARELDRTQKSTRARSKHRLKKPRCILDGLENRLQGHHFAYQIGPKSPPRRSGAPLERSSGSRSAPGTHSGRSRDAPGRSQHAPECSRDVLRTLLAPLGASSGCHGSTFSPNSFAFPRQRGFGPDFQ